MTIHSPTASADDTHTKEAHTTDAPARAGVLITGGALRIGAHLAEVCAARGHDLAIHSLDSKPQAEALGVRLANMHGVRVVILTGDLLRPAVAESLVGEAELALGAPLGVLIHNACLFQPAQDKQVREPDLLGNHLAVNVEAPWRMTRALAAACAQREGTAQAILITDAFPQLSFAALPEYAASAVARTGSVPALAAVCAPQVRVQALALAPTLRGVRESAAHFTASLRACGLGAAAPLEAVGASLARLLDGAGASGDTLTLAGDAHATSGSAHLPPADFRLFVRALEVQCRIGVSAAERASPQSLRISFAASADVRARDDALETTADYGALAELIRQAAADNTHRLLESLGDDLAARLFAAEARLEAIWLCIEKPDIFADAEGAGVELVRHRTP